MEKFLKTVALLALVGGAFAYTGCTDYDSDIDSLDARLSAVESSVSTLQAKIDAGAVITSVESVTGGVKVTLSDGKTFTITNGVDGQDGKDGADGKDGIDGQDGKDGADGKDGIDGQDGKDGADGKDANTVYYYPGDNGYFIKVTITPDGTKTEETTEISYISGDAVSAIYTDNYIKFQNVEGAAGDVVIYLTKGVAYISILDGEHELETYAKLDFSIVTKKTNTFGPNDELTFTAGDNFSEDATALIRVSPANAEFAASDIHLINSKGASLDDYVEVKELAAYDKLLTKSGETGLYLVTFALKDDIDQKAFSAATVQTNKDKTTNDILFALTIENDDESVAISGYDFYVTNEQIEANSELVFAVDGKDVAEINNRYSTESNSMLEDYSGTLPTEYVWSGDAAVKMVTVATATEKVNVEQGDNRDDKNLLQVNQGEAFKVELGELVNGKVVQMEHVRGFYVSLDLERAVESGSSEKAAWKGYEYEGLDELVEGTSTSITIDWDSKINDIIGFRVYAVNDDGTLVDPDGRAFYLEVGDAESSWGLYATTITPEHESILDTRSEKADKYAGFEKISSSMTATWKCADDEHPFDVIFVDADKNEYVNENILTALENTKDGKFSIYTEIADGMAWSDYEDGKTYSGTLTISNEKGRVFKYAEITFTKVLPKAAPKDGYSRKTNQIVDDVYNCYLIPDNWASGQATAGSMAIMQYTNIDEDLAKNYKFTFAESQKDANGKDVDIVLDGTGTLSVDKSYITGASHKTTVTYSYGNISSAKDEKGNLIPVEFKVDSCTTNYMCIYDKSNFTWSWNTTKMKTDSKKSGYVAPNEFEYGETKDVDIASYITGVCKSDSKYNAKSLAESYESSIKIVSAEVISKANLKEEYIDVEDDLSGYSVLSDSTNPTADVASTLKITVKDSYGHTDHVEITLDVTVKKRQ